MITGHTEKHRVETARGSRRNRISRQASHRQEPIRTRLAEIVERPRPIGRSDGDVGPDRRRKLLENYAGPWRRHDESSDVGVH